MNTREMDNIGVKYAPETEALFTVSALSQVIRERYDSQEWNDFVTKLYDISIEERNLILGKTIGLSGNPSVDQDTRDLAVGICAKMLSLEGLEIQKDVAIEFYCQAVDGLSADDDDMGAPYSLLELGNIMKSRLGVADTFDESVNLKGKVIGAWNKYNQKFNGHKNVHPAWIDQAYMMGRELLPYAEALNEENPRWEWSREMPELSDNQKPLHNNFLKVVRREGSFKQFLYKNSPQFQVKAKESGIDPAGYWNLNDPESGQRIVNGLGSLPESLRKKFEASLEEYSLKIADFQADPGLSRVMSDQIVEISHKIYQDSYIALSEPADVVQKLVGQSLLTRQADKPAKVVKPLKNLLVSLNLASSSASWSEVCDRIEDPEVISALNEFYQNKYQQVIKGLNGLRELLPEQNPHLVMSRRGESDLYAGDWTRDCTAYHLVNGFNAWTVPNWLACPDINIMYAVDGGKFISKFTTLLAIDQQGKPRVIIDSLETNKYIPDERRALEVIHKAMMEIQSWSDRLGLGDVMVCTYSNSTEIVNNLPTKPQDQEASKNSSLAMFSGRLGLREVGESLTSRTDFYDNIYLQSEEVEGELINEYEQTLLNGLESMINAAADKLSPENRTKYYKIARSEDWGKFLKAYLVAEAPRFKSTFDLDEVSLQTMYSSFNEYAELEPNYLAQIRPALFSKIIGHVIDRTIFNIREAELGFADLEGFHVLEYSDDIYADDDVAAFNVIGDVTSIKYINSAKGRGYVTKEAETVLQLLDIVAELSLRGITSELALRKIFGRAGSNSVSALVTNLPIINRQLPNTN